MSWAGGTFLATKKNGEITCRSSIYYKKKHISLGTFSTEEEARKAYLEAEEILHGTAPIRLEDHTPSAALSFSKWVMLVTLRDTGRYYRTPISPRADFFYYYVSRGLRLRFDPEDLTFFATHKITQRGRGFFVTVDGRQVPLLSLFGIHAHAVAGRDYEFLDGNARNLRRGNIRILNPYHGVRKEFRKGMPVYAARIHVNGDLLIGRYSTEEEAAIAYNKAADLLGEQGCPIHYPRNVVAGMEEFDLERIYHLVKVAEKVRSGAYNKKDH